MSASTMQGTVLLPIVMVIVVKTPDGLNPGTTFKNNFSLQNASKVRRQ